jgi:hypothetical protein
MAASVHLQGPEGRRKANAWRGKHFPLYPELERIFSGKSATGEHAAIPGTRSVRETREPRKKRKHTIVEEDELEDTEIDEIPDQQ